MTREGQGTSYTLGTARGRLWVHPCWRPQGNQTPRSTQRGQGGYCSMGPSSCLPRHLRTPTRLSTKAAEECYRMPLCTAIPRPVRVCAQLVHKACFGGNQDESLGGRKRPQQPIARIFVLFNAFYWELHIPCKIAGWGFWFGGFF